MRENDLQVAGDLRDLRKTRRCTVSIFECDVCSGVEVDYEIVFGAGFVDRGHRSSSG
jgi:hypothetical protein